MHVACIHVSTYQTLPSHQNQRIPLHMHTYIHTCRNAYIHTCRHTSRQSASSTEDSPQTVCHKKRRLSVHFYTYIHTRMHTYMCVNTPTGSQPPALRTPHTPLSKSSWLSSIFLHMRRSGSMYVCMYVCMYASM
jgi:hypothetical protein